MLLPSNIISLFDFFLPRICYACNKVLAPDETYVCPSCFELLTLTPTDYIAHEYNRHFRETGYIKEIIPLYLFEKDKTIQKLMHQLKYNKKFRTGLFLGRIISEYHSEVIERWNADFIVPVPLNILKKADRGYNQAEFIAKGISQNSKIPVKANLLKRVKHTSTQTKLNKEERKQNMEGAFEARSIKVINGKNIILVDDVITTGSTINECAKILKESGANDVYALSAGVA